MCLKNNRNRLGNGEVSIQHDSYLRIGEKLQSYISSESTCFCVIFKDNLPENVGVYPNSTSHFILPTESICLSSKKNVNIHKKPDLDLKTIIYPKKISE